MADFNEELVAEINSLRTNPRIYARTISKYITYFKGKLLCLPGSNAGIQTEEGPDAYREAADFLSRQSRIEALKPSKGLCRIAEDFIAAVQKDSNDLESKDMEDIINKYGSFSGSFSRAMDFGGETPEQAVINLIVSDGDKSRGQREALLSTEIKKIGVANGEHKTYRHCSAIVTSTEFENTYDYDDNGLLTEKKDNKNGEEETKEKIRPKRVVLKNKEDDNDDKKYTGKYQRKTKYNEKNEEELPKGVASLDKTEKVIMENGCKKKITKIIKIMDDGSKQIETTKEVVDE
jgi:YD repeat-containing protein